MPAGTPGPGRSKTPGRGPCPLPSGPSLRLGPAFLLLLLLRPWCGGRAALHHRVQPPQLRRGPLDLRLLRRHAGALLRRAREQQAQLWVHAEAHVRRAGGLPVQGLVDPAVVVRRL